MKLSFLQRITGLGSITAGQVVGSGPAVAAVRYLLAEIPELLLAAVLEAGSGEVQAALSSTRNFQPAAVAGPATAVLRQLQGLLAAQQLPTTGPSEVVLTLTTQLHVLQLAPNGRQLLYLAVDARDTNLAILRQVAGGAVGLLASQSPD